MNTPEHSFFGISAASVLNMQEEETEMLFWSITFLLLAIIAGVLGFGGIAGAAAGIAEILFFVFLVLLVISAIAAAVRGRPPL